MNRQKVIHIVEDLKIGGAEKVIESIAIGLNKYTYNVEVWCIVKGGNVADNLIGKGITVKILNLTNYYNPLNILKLSILLRKSKPQIIHLHGYFASTFARLAAILIPKTIIITHVHTTYNNLIYRNLLIERLLSVITDKIICISEAVRKFVEIDEKISAEKTVLIYNGVEDPQKFSEHISNRKNLIELDIGNDQKVILIVASLQPHKGHIILIDAIFNIFKIDTNVRLLIVGGGPLRGILEKYVQKKKHSDKIFFTGEQEDVFSFIKASDIFILPSIGREGLGLAIIEAMAMGLPVIGSEIGGIPELIEDGINGKLFPPGDSVALSNAIIELLSDKKKMMRMGTAARKKYETHFHQSEMIKSVDNLYRKLLKRKYD